MIDVYSTGAQRDVITTLNIYPDCYNPRSKCSMAKQPKHMHLAVAVGVKRLVLYAPREASSGDVFPSCDWFKYGSLSQYGGSLVP